MTSGKGPPQPVDATVSAEAAGRHPWQVVVVGAGPAGALAARELARRGLQVLLVDKAAFPRSKVCGGCLGPAAIELLRGCGLGQGLARLGAERTTTLRLVGSSASATLGLDGGVAISRAVFDAFLLREAIAQGAEFLDATTVRLGDTASPGLRSLRLRTGGRTTDASAQMVVAADGLAGGLAAAERGLEAEVAPNSRIGLGTTIPGSLDFCEPGVITMTCGPHGYLGLVQVEHERINVAAAFDAALVRTAGGPFAAVRRHLEAIDFPVLESLAQAHWSGTPALTRKRPALWGERLLVIGDAAGYVEPFTGEGMTWALRSANAVAPLASIGVSQWSAEIGRQWQQTHRRLIQHRQRTCRIVAALSRHRHLAELAIRLCRCFPWLGRRAIRSVSRTGTHSG
jgi:flavin-dependent dehydrogenase